jgi:hypothetical protein
MLADITGLAATYCSYLRRSGMGYRHGCHFDLTACWSLAAIEQLDSPVST